MRRFNAGRKVDVTSKALIAEAIRLGAQYAPADGTYDGVLWLPSGRIEIVDWKGDKAGLTPSQCRLAAAGWPIKFVHSVEQVERLVRQG